MKGQPNQAEKLSALRYCQREIMALAEAGADVGEILRGLNAVIAQLEAERPLSLGVHEGADAYYLWRNGDHFVGYRHLYPCDDDGDPLTLGEPVGYVAVKPSRDRGPSAPPEIEHPKTKSPR